MNNINQYSAKAKLLFPHSVRMQLQWMLQKFDIAERKIELCNFTRHKAFIETQKKEKKWRVIKND